MSDEPTKVQVKLSRAALERLIGDDVQLEMALGHQAVNAMMQRYGDKLLETLEKHIAAGVDLQGSHVRNVELNNHIRRVIQGEVGNYLRCHDSQIKLMISQAIGEQLPGIIESAVKSALQKAADRVVAALSQPKPSSPEVEAFMALQNITKTKPRSIQPSNIIMPTTGTTQSILKTASEI